MTHVNQWGERILAQYVDTYSGDDFKDYWQVMELRENDFDRTHYGREFELKKGNESGTQGWVAGRLTREGLAGLRDMLTAALEAGQ